jgi:hypothetical protein
MQELADKIVKNFGIIMAAISTLLVMAAPLVGLVVSAAVAAGWLKAESGFAVFVAKIFPLSLHAQSGKPRLPPVGPAAILLLAIGASVTQAGCGASALHPKIEQALLFEDQVHAQVKNLEGVFDATLLMMPEAQRPEWQAKLAFAKQQLGTALEAKDAALRAALAASDSNVDISAVVGQIVQAVTGIVEIVDAMGASKPVVAHARAKAAALNGGL